MVPQEVPLRVDFTFYLDRPKSTHKSRTWPTVKPDYDKLARAATDALTGVLYADDAQICQSTIQKKYGSPARAELVVRVLATRHASKRSMTAYYNENDPFKTEVILEAIKAGAIAPGDIDERS